MEILAQSSPLSRWVGQTVIKHLRFKLHFDDPRLPEEHKVIIQGDRDQLEELNHTVIFYVQQLLQQSSENFSVRLSESIKPEIKDGSTPASIGKIYLEPSGNLTHKLYLGSLSDQTASPVVQLSVLQLFDLATALDEYSSDVMTLPTLNSDISGSRLPNWASVAAILVFAAGLTPLTWQYANHIRQKHIQTAKKPTPTTTAKIAALPSPYHLSLNTPQPGFNPPNSPDPFANPSSTSQPPTSQLPTDGIAPPDIFANSTPTPTAKTYKRNLLALPQAPSSSLSNSVKKDLQIPGGNLQRNSPVAIAQNDLDIPHRQNTLAQNYNTSRVTAGVASRLSDRNIAAQAPAPIDTRMLDNSVSKESLARQFSAAQRRASQPTELATDSTLFDTPQVAEARAYLKKRWQPPAGLSQTLEYSLTVGIDGSLERLLPLNQAARDFVDSSGIPEIGKSFVSANKYGQNIRLRVVLSPDGKVQTFPESR
jgi:hypothetical protein